MVCSWISYNLKMILVVQLSWASEGFFPGGATRWFFQYFSRGGQKWWNLVFTTRN